MSDSQSVPTMAVVHPEGDPRGFVVINASDFDPAVHVKWPDASPDAAPDAPTAPKAASSKRGSKS